MRPSAALHSVPAGPPVPGLLVSGLLVLVLMSLGGCAGSSAAGADGSPAPAAVPSSTAPTTSPSPTAPSPTAPIPPAPIPTAPPAAGAAAGAAAPPVPVTKLLVFVVENHSLAQMSAQMPYTYRLAKTYGYATSYFAVRHPSLPNYLAIASGSTHKISSNAAPADNFPVHGASVFGRAIAAGRTAAVYADAMPANCAMQPSGRYAVKHNPWPYFAQERALCRKYDLPVSALGAAVDSGSLPNAGMVVPDLCHDAHDCSLATADRWFQGWMTRIQAGPDWKAGRLTVVLTADEDDKSAGNRVLTVVAHPSQQHRVVTTRLGHYSLTRLYAEVTGTAPLGNAATAPSMAKAFALPLS